MQQEWRAKSFGEEIQELQLRAEGGAQQRVVLSEQEGLVRVGVAEDVRDEGDDTIARRVGPVEPRKGGKEAAKRQRVLVLEGGLFVEDRPIPALNAALIREFLSRAGASSARRGSAATARLLCDCPTQPWLGP